MPGAGQRPRRGGHRSIRRPDLRSARSVLVDRQADEARPAPGRSGVVPAEPIGIGVYTPLPEQVRGRTRQ
jgi:hypothetical protein